MVWIHFLSIKALSFFTINIVHHSQPVHVITIMRKQCFLSGKIAKNHIYPILSHPHLPHQINFARLGPRSKWPTHPVNLHFFQIAFIIDLSKLQNVFVKTAKCICPNSEFICRNCKMYFSKFRLGPSSNHERPTRLVKGKSLLMSSSFGFTERETAFTAIALHRILKNCKENWIENTKQS